MAKPARRGEQLPEGIFDNSWILDGVRPDNKEVRAILERQIEGSYRFVHHALVPYVRVGPATGKWPITIHHGDRLHLAAETDKRVTGVENTVDFAILFQPHVVLKEVVGIRDQAKANRMLDQLKDPAMLPKFDEKDTKGLNFRQGGVLFNSRGGTNLPSASSGGTLKASSDSGTNNPPGAGESQQEHATRRVQEVAQELNDVLRYAKHVGVRTVVVLRDDGDLPQVTVATKP